MDVHGWSGRARTNGTTHGARLIESAVVTKKRYIWQVSALRSVREESCIRYARRVVPSLVGGVRIEFPDTRVSLGPQIVVTSCRLEGQDLFSLLYDRELRCIVLDLGMVALRALHSADVTSNPFAAFSLVYRLTKGPKTVLAAAGDLAEVSRTQHKELRRLVSGYMTRGGDRKVLVHGDLHPSHLITSLGDRSLGFIDLEAMHVGKSATNFAQLWNGFHYADPELGRLLYRRFAEHFPDHLSGQFDEDVRTELALRSYSHIQAGKRLANRELQAKGHALLADVLSGESFESLCTREQAPEHTESL